MSIEEILHKYEKDLRGNNLEDIYIDVSSNNALRNNLTNFLINVCGIKDIGVYFKNKIPDYCFSGCEILTDITIQDTVKYIGDWAFSRCSNLTRITIPDSVTSIGWYAFYGCSSLTSITIQNGVTYIGEGAFHGCTSLDSITYDGTKAEWRNIRKSKDWRDSSSVKSITCLDGIIELK